jgi:hypothetical protein
MCKFGETPINIIAAQDRNGKQVRSVMGSHIGINSKPTPTKSI